MGTKAARRAWSGPPRIPQLAAVQSTRRKAPPLKTFGPFSGIALQSQAATAIRRSLPMTFGTTSRALVTSSEVLKRLKEKRRLARARIHRE